jgi:hypothetical protein
MTALQAPRKTKVPKLNLDDVASYRHALGENQSASGRASVSPRAGAAATRAGATCRSQFAS